ncbi:MAG TPA: type II secretion system protein GspG [Planctomycetota bacterium]
MKAAINSLLLIGLLAPAGLAQGPLAHELPDDTLIYLEVPDIQAMIQGAGASSLGRIYGDDEVQNFTGPLLKMLDQGWVQTRQMAQQMGLDPEVLQWDSFSNFEFGFCIAPGTGEVPSLCVAASLGMRAGRAAKTFGFLQGMAREQGFAEAAEGEHGPVLRIEYNDEELVEIRLQGDRLVFWAQTANLGSGKLAASGSFQKARGQAMFDGASVFGFIRPSSGINTMMQMLRTQEENVGELMESIMSRIGVNSIESVAFASGWQNGDSVSAGVVDFGEKGPSGVFASAAQHALDLGMLDYVPDNATSFSLFSADVGEMWTLMQGILTDVTAIETRPGRTVDTEWRESGHPSYDWIVGERSQLLGKGMHGFGKQGFTYSVASGSMMGGPAAGGAFFKLDDPAAVSEMLHGFMPQLSDWLSSVEELPVELESKPLIVRERDADGRTVSREGPEYYVLKINSTKLPAEMRQMSFLLAQFTPTFGVTADGWLAVAPSRIAVTNALRKGVEKPENAVRKNAEVSAFLGSLPKGVTALSWSDPRPGIEGAVTMVKGFLPMITMQIPADQIPVDLNAVPGPAPFVNNMRPTEMYTFIDANGRIVSKSRGSFDIADALVLCGVGAAVAPAAMMWFRAESMEAQPHARAEEPAEPSPSKGAVSPKAGPEQVRAVRDELDRLRTGVIVYQLENNAYPQSLSVLTVATDKYPFGYLPKPDRGLPKDPWGNAYKLVLRNGSYLLYSAGPNGADEGGASDDIGLDG